MVIAESPKTPTIPITEIEQSAFCQTDEKLQAKSLEEEFSGRSPVAEDSDLLPQGKAGRA